jgi:hypothetical protein
MHTLFVTVNEIDFLQRFCSFIVFTFSAKEVVIKYHKFSKSLDTE